MKGREHAVRAVTGYRWLVAGKKHAAYGRVFRAPRYDKDGIATGPAGAGPVERNGPKSACAHFVWRLAPKPVAFDGRQVHRDASEPAGLRYLGLRP